MYISKYVLINTISDILELLFLDEPKLWDQIIMYVS